MEEVSKDWIDFIYGFKEENGFDFLEVIYCWNLIWKDDDGEKFVVVHPMFDKDAFWVKRSAHDIEKPLYFLEHGKKWIFNGETFDGESEPTKLTPEQEYAAYCKR